LEIAFDKVTAKGHENVRALHKTTFEITRDPWLTLKGDCIIAVSADKAVCHLSREFKSIASNDDSIIIAVLTCNDVYDIVVGRGSSKLTFEDCRRMVFRKSTFTSKDTIMIKASKSSRELSRKLIEKLKNPNIILEVYLIAIRV